MLEFRKKIIKFDTDEEIPYNQEFTISEFQHALSTTKETSPGPDEITYLMLKKAHPSFQNLILKIINKIYQTGKLPSQWKNAIIIPIPKPGKDLSEPLNFRPIALTSCICKLNEKMVNFRLNWYLEANNLISSSQFGFRKSLSAVDALVKFENDSHDAISNGKHEIAVLFDLKKAYDTTWRHGVLKKLHEYGLRGNLPKFICDFLTNRTIRVRVGKTLSNPYPLIEGIPQGSVLSCTLFMIAINEITNSLPADIKTALYVDDLTI